MYRNHLPKSSETIVQISHEMQLSAPTMIPMLGPTHTPDKLMKVPWAAIETKSTIGQQ